jgi:hypothetical protein
MTGRPSLKLLSCVLAVGVAGCASFYEIPIETPIAAKLDVSAFQRVFIAGFLSGGTDDVDGNLETVRLLRSQLRMKSNLRVVDADVLPLLDVASGRTEGGPSTPGREPNTEAPEIKNEKDLQPYEHEGMLDKAAEAYERALKLEPNSTFVRQNFELFKEIHDRTTQSQTP